MAFNVTNVFASGTKANASDVNQNFTDIETQIDSINSSLNNKVDESSGVLSGDMNANSNKITNLADGSADGDAVNKGQLDEITSWPGFGTYQYESDIWAGVSGNVEIIYKASADGFVYLKPYKNADLGGEDDTVLVYISPDDTTYTQIDYMDNCNEAITFPIKENTYIKIEKLLGDDKCLMYFTPIGSGTLVEQ